MNRNAPQVFELRGAVSSRIGARPLDVDGHAPATAPLIETIESRRGPWQVNGAYGRSNRFVFPASLDADPIAIFSTDRQLGPPRPRTLHFFRNDSQVEGGVVNADLYGLVTYGVGAVQNSFLCDWGRGGQISLVCDAVRVEAVPYTPNAGVPYLPPFGEQLLGCLLSHEGSAPPRPPTFTSQLVGIATANTAVFTVPDFARWVFPMGIVRQADPATDLISFLNANATLLKLLPLTDGLLRLGTPIPGGTTTIEIDNVSGGFRGYALQFELGL